MRNRLKESKPTKLICGDDGTVVVQTQPSKTSNKGDSLLTYIQKEKKKKKGFQLSLDQKAAHLQATERSMG